MIIEDISEGKGKAYAARFPQLQDSVAMGDDIDHLFEGIDLMLESCRSHKMVPALNVKKYVAMLDFSRNKIVQSASLKSLNKNINAIFKTPKSASSIRSIAIKTRDSRKKNK